MVLLTSFNIALNANTQAVHFGTEAVVAALAGSRAGWERTACFAAAARVAGSVGPVETAGLPRRSSCPCTGRSRDRACTSWTSWRSLRESWVVGVFETAVSYVGILVAIGEVRGAENSGLQMLWLGDGFLQMLAWPDLYTKGLYNLPGLIRG